MLIFENHERLAKKPILKTEISLSKDYEKTTKKLWTARKTTQKFFFLPKVHKLLAKNFLLLFLNSEIPEQRI